MTHRLALHLLVPVWLCTIACGSAVAASGFTDAEKHAAEERALRAQIEHMDDDIQKLDTQIYALEHDKTPADPARIAKEDALREQVHHMNREEEVILDRLGELEKQDPPGTAHPQASQLPVAAQPTASVVSATPVPPAPVQPPPPAPAPAMAPPPAVAAPSPDHGPSLRSAADPAVYEKAAGDPVSVFNYNPYKWLPVGTRQIAVYNSYDDAFLLDLADDCPTLLTAERIRIENFSTRVVAGRDGVTADGARCPIVRIRPLHLNRLPR